ncbi:MAG: GNAT family N-acetyltransferase [Anaerolineae bacterium]|nr:MAG: GNAT family N-acetyltransferase [Anaerolineae bacterium]
MITIDFLADHIDVIPTLAQWFRAQWPDYFADWSQEDMEQDFREDASRERLPIRLVAFVAGELAGTIILRTREERRLADYQPELGGLYVRESHRRQGVGAELVREGMSLARTLGYSAVYATTVAAAGILERLGWEFVKTIVHEDGENSLYCCNL